MDKHDAGCTLINIFINHVPTFVKTVIKLMFTRDSC